MRDFSRFFCVFACFWRFFICLGLFAGFVDLFLLCFVLVLVVFDVFLIMSAHLFAGTYYFCVYVDVRKCYWQMGLFVVTRFRY